VATPANRVAGKQRKYLLVKEERGPRKWV